MLKSKKWKKLRERDNRREKSTEGTRFRRDFSEGTEKEGEEKNSSSTQAKWGRREKSSLTTQENL